MFCISITVFGSSVLGNKSSSVLVPQKSAIVSVGYYQNCTNMHNLKSADVHILLIYFCDLMRA